MGQPVKLSENLVLDARIVGETSERSIARAPHTTRRLALVPVSSVSPL